MQPTRPHDPWAHRRGEPRLFVVLWTGYLLAASVLVLGSVGMMGLVATDIYRPAARMLLAMCGLGVSTLWPMVRLSQSKPLAPLQAFAIDAVVMAVPATVVMASQSMPWMAAWSVSVAGVVACSYAAWSILISGLLALYFAHFESRVPRWAWMLLIVVLVSAPPAAAALMMGVGAPSRLEQGLLMASPVSAPFEATSERDIHFSVGVVAAPHFLGALIPLVPALAAWGWAAQRPRHNGESGA